MKPIDVTSIAFDWHGLDDVKMKMWQNGINTNFLWFLCVCVTMYLRRYSRSETLEKYFMKIYGFHQNLLKSYRYRPAKRDNYSDAWSKFSTRSGTSSSSPSPSLLAIASLPNPLTELEYCMAIFLKFARLSGPSCWMIPGNKSCNFFTWDGPDTTYVLAWMEAWTTCTKIKFYTAMC